MVKEVCTKEALDEVFEEAGDKVVALDFYATWCNPCRYIAPKFQEFSEKYPNVICLKIDADQAEDIVESMNVQAMPTFIFFRNKIEVHRIMGTDASQLEECFKKFN